jgi:hypothetical protein
MSRIKRSTVIPTLKTAKAGDLSYVLPGRYLYSIIEMLKAMNKICDGVYDKDTLLYGIEPKFYSTRVDVDYNFETIGVHNLFTIGDGAGMTRGLVQSAMSGLIVGDEILKRIK